MGRKVLNEHHNHQGPHHAGGGAHGDHRAHPAPQQPHVLHRIATRHRIAVLVILVVATLAFLSTWWI